MKVLKSRTDSNIMYLWTGSKSSDESIKNGSFTDHKRVEIEEMVEFSPSSFDERVRSMAADCIMPVVAAQGYNASIAFIRAFGAFERDAKTAYAYKLRLEQSTQ